MSINPTFGVELWVILTGIYTSLVACGFVVHLLSFVFRTKSPGTVFLYRDDFYLTLSARYIVLFFSALLRIGFLWIFHERYDGEDPYTISSRTDVDNREKRLIWIIGHAWANLTILFHMYLYFDFLLVSRKKSEPVCEQPAHNGKTDQDHF